MNLLSRLAALTLVGAIALPALPAQADKLDDIIASGVVRCAAVLDFPPLGSRYANNEPLGLDVDYCKDRAAGFGGRNNALAANDQYTEAKTIWVDLSDNCRLRGHHRF